MATVNNLVTMIDFILWIVIVSMRLNNTVHCALYDDSLNNTVNCALYNDSLNNTVHCALYNDSLPKKVGEQWPSNSILVKLLILGHSSLNF